MSNNTNVRYTNKNFITKSLISQKNEKMRNVQYQRPMESNGFEPSTSISIS